MKSRRHFLQAAATWGAASVFPGYQTALATKPTQKSQLGLVAYCCRIRQETMKRQKPPVDLYAPLMFLQHCQAVGAGGMQVALGNLDEAGTRELRDAAERMGLFIEAIISVPQNESDLDRFAAQMKTAVAVNAQAVRTTIIPGRRYEFFDSLEMFREYEAHGKRALERAAPIAEKLRLPLAVENHKDHRNAERVALFEHISSEYVGACLDTGNSVALLEEAVETAQALAPWTHAVHLKDQAVQPYDQGFLLADIPLGEGALNLKKIVDVIRAAKPKMRFCLELITRDPLRVPALTEKYWRTFPDLPARDLARTLRVVYENASERLQYVSRLSPDAQLTLEDANVAASLQYAHKTLDI